MTGLIDIDSRWESGAMLPDGYITSRYINKGNIRYIFTIDCSQL